MDKYSGVGVIDKSVSVLTALETGPLNLGELVELTGLPRPTAHRLAQAWEYHQFIDRDPDGRFRLGPRLAQLASAIHADRLIAAAGPILAALRDRTGESAQLYTPRGRYRICVAAAERQSGLRDTVPVGSSLSMKAGSAAQILLAWEEPERIRRGIVDARFSAAELATVRRRGWAQSAEEREPGVASVSAPVTGPAGKVVAALSISGPIERLGRRPGPAHSAALVTAANRLTEILAN